MAGAPHGPAAAATGASGPRRAPAPRTRPRFTARAVGAGPAAVAAALLLLAAACAARAQGIGTKPIRIPPEGYNPNPSNCSELSASVAAARADARGPAPPRGARDYVISLGCGPAFDFSDCGPPEGGGGGGEEGGRAAALVLEGRGAHLVLRADPATCAGGARPVLSSRGGGGGGAPPRLVAVRGGASLTLESVVIDGGGGRPCVAFGGAGGNSDLGALRLENVDLLNCAAPGDGGALLVAGGARAELAGGRLAGGAAGGGGGALAIVIPPREGRPAAGRGLFLKATGVVFSRNSAARGGAVSITKTSQGAAGVSLLGCRFEGNAAAAGCSALASERRDARPGGRPGGALKLDLTGSTFEGDAAPGSVPLCGLAPAALKAPGASKVKGVPTHLLRPLPLPNAALAAEINDFAYGSLPPPAGRR
ncbi:MAG: hypothetical protein J3K34DRAFT_485920 [Monoraphidium minutum]|nr:MAG: hypothetical protein J3K34DRAFT_485920 [Monoraphidium minutum]